MTELFLTIFNRSVSASWLILAVLVLRIFLKKAPKWVHVMLWAIVAVRLVMPVSIESPWSLIPSAETISPSLMTEAPAITTGFPAFNNAIAPIIQGSAVTVAPEKTVNTMKLAVQIISQVWALGVAVLLIYTAASYGRLRRRVREAIRLRGNIYQSEGVESPFVLGIVKPRIYLPYGIGEPELGHVIAHEQAHIKRRDHWWKPLGFLLLTVHWLNPLMWLAYGLLCRDIELACDEKVIRDLENDQRADYTQALVNCSVSRRMIAACPLAFGEVGVKDRVRSVMNYKKPAFWVVLLALAACVAVAVCFLTDPNPSREFPMAGVNVSDLDPEGIVERILDIEDWESSNVYCNTDQFSLMLDSEFNWMHDQTVRYFFTDADHIYSAQLRMFPEENKFFLTEPTEWLEQGQIYLLRHYLDALKYLPQEEIRQMAPADQYSLQHRAEGTPGSYDRVITYTPEGVGELDGWFIHLELQPGHAVGDAYQGTGDEVIHLFYGSGVTRTTAQAQRWFDGLAEPDDEFWTSIREITHPAFPGVTFRCSAYDMEAVTEAGTETLFTGMPIWNAYFADLTGDGLPELCSTLCWGSGMIDQRVILYDYANAETCTLMERGTFDFCLRQHEDSGLLYVDEYAYLGGGYVNSGLLTTGGAVFRDGVLELRWVHEPSADIRNIIDPTDDPNFSYDTACEKIYEDEYNEYILGGLYSGSIIVQYYDGTQENIVTALNAGRATIADLDRFGIRYWAEPKQEPLDPATSETGPEYEAALREKYPEYFGLDTSNGLYVYVWQMAENSYSFGLLPGTDRPLEHTSEELLGMRGVDAQQMRAILATYQLPQEQIYIIPWRPVYSSYIPDLFIREERDYWELEMARYVKMVRDMVLPSRDAAAE